jgi:hypothetical protein
MGKYLKTYYLRDLETRLNRGEISYGYMLELIEIEIIRNYNKENERDKKIYK